jgi:hypothetical protein
MYVCYEGDTAQNMNFVLVFLLSRHPYSGLGQLVF